MSKERRVDPQVQVGLLVDPAGFPLEVHCFEGYTAETTTLIPVLSAFQQRHGTTDMVVVADAGMLSAGNLNADKPRMPPTFRSPRASQLRPDRPFDPGQSIVAVLRNNRTRSHPRGACCGATSGDTVAPGSESSTPTLQSLRRCQRFARRASTARQFKIS
jgi:hypothetical protein